ncbi:MAG: hypothetical protein NTU61_01480 [Candidatus Altiarchaeota archaeon]|nr:hypothetical protein [Candidatus Altiarchaeota archaeon]
MVEVLSDGQRRQMETEFKKLQEKLGLPDPKELNPPVQPKPEGFLGALFSSPIPPELEQKIRDEGIKIAELQLRGVEIQAKYQPEVAADLRRYNELRGVLFDHQQKKT